MALGRALDDLDRGGKTLAPTFAFLDPFGISGIPFALVRRLLERPRCEAFITFMVDSLNRWLEHPNESIRGHIIDTFGTEEALRIATGPGDRVGQLRDLYQSQLGTVARYVRFFEMRDRNDRTQYLLFFATNHGLGHVKMKEAMWKADPEGAFRFSDATVPEQLVLFETDPTPLLLNLLNDRFQGQSRVEASQVCRFVEDETQFLKTHMKHALRLAEAEGGLLVDTLKADGAKRRAGTFPHGVRMVFLGSSPSA